MIKAIIFDLDGTLINTIDDLADATNNALRINGFPIRKIEEYNNIIGNGVIQQIKRALPTEYKNDEQTINKVIQDFSKQYEKNWMNKTVLYEGINELLNKLKENGFLQAVASNKPDFFTQKIVKHYFEDNIFDFVSGNTPELEKKPSPDIAFKIIKELDVTADECIFVGDTNVDINTAKNAGIFSIGCLWGFRTRQELENAGADLIVSHPDEIFQYILTTRKG